ncbi:hypothetical protein J3R82DRAFT_523 [Butyriboletus roseoflavus]|nr:hypothetical protein J3R82DRAFT_523 [Butyriboletus roseoflavus]
MSSCPLPSPTQPCPQPEIHSGSVTKFVFFLSHSPSHSHPPKCHAEMRPLMVSPSPRPPPPSIHVFLDTRSHLRLLPRVVCRKGAPLCLPYLSILTPPSLRIQSMTLAIFKITSPTRPTTMTSPAHSTAFCVPVPSPLSLIIPRPNSLPLGSWNTSDDFVTPPRTRSPPTQRAQDHSAASSGLRFEFHSGPGGGSSRTFILGGSNPLGRSPSQPDRPVPTMFEFLRRETDNANNTRNPGDITGPLMAQYLLAMFGREPHGRGDPFAELLGMPPSARWGDYVFNQEALDQILTQLAENSTAGRPVAATEEITSNLPREVLTEGSPLLGRDCAVCKESFKLDPEDPDELVVVTLPCKHPFHQTCILPWLKSSGTCPVCRFALIAQPQQHSPGGPSGGTSSSNRTSPPSGSRPRSPGNSDRGGGGGGLFHALFGGGAGASSRHSDAYLARSQRNLGRENRNIQPEVILHSTPSFPGQWIEDID